MSRSIPIEKLTKADLPKTVIHLAWPVVLETTFFGLGGIINTILVGRLGASALAAVGLGQQIEFMIQVAFAAVTVGTTAVVSRHVGAKEIKEANQAVGQALMLALILGLFFSLLLWLFAGPAIKLLRGRPDVVKLGGHLPSIRGFFLCALFYHRGLRFFFPGSRKHPDTHDGHKRGDDLQYFPGIFTDLRRIRIPLSRCLGSRGGRLRFPPC